MSVWKVSATPGIVTTRISSGADRSAGCWSGGVVWMPNRGWAQNSLSGVNTTPGLHRQCPRSRCMPKSHTRHWYSPIKWMVATRIQLSQSPICKSLPLQPSWKSFQALFNPPPVLLAYQNPKPTTSRWMIWPQRRAPETSFWAGLELNTCGLENSHLLIDESDEHSAAWLPHQVICVQIRWLYWEQCSILCWYLPDQGTPHHPPLAPEPPVHLWLCSFFAQWSLPVAPM